MTLNELITNNNDYLIKVAKRITGKVDYRLGTELYTSTYLEIYERGIDYPKQDQDFIKWFCKYMTYRFMSGGSFTKQIKSKECLSIDADSKSSKPSQEWNTFADMVVDESALSDVELYAEDVNEVTKELIGISSSLGKSKTFKYIQCLEFRASLHDHEKHLFDLFFEQRVSTRKIAEMYSDNFNVISYQSINKMINVIKDKIKKYKWE